MNRTIQSEREMPESQYMTRLTRYAWNTLDAALWLLALAGAVSLILKMLNNQ